MLNSMYISTSAMKLNQRIADINASNLSNVNTTGFKKDTPVIESFPDVLLSKINDKIDFDNHKPFKGLLEKIGEDEFTASIDSGYFRVETPLGISHNRDLKFTKGPGGLLKTFYIDSDGKRKVNDENTVLGSDGKKIHVPGTLSVDEYGRVLSDGKVVASLVSFPSLDVIGTVNGGSRVKKIVTDFTQGKIITTGNNLDFALNGQGFFKVVDSEGRVSYTRDGAFTVDSTGTLVTKDGKRVLGKNGVIVLKADDSRDDLKSLLRVVDIENKEDLVKIGDNTYTNREETTIIETEFKGEVLESSLEGSNIDIIKEMIGMITGFRSYETSQKIISTQDEILGKVVNDLGRV